jgi:hypothetical protein
MKSPANGRVFLLSAFWARRAQLGELGFRAALLRASERPQAVLAGWGSHIFIDIKGLQRCSPFLLGGNNSGGYVALVFAHPHSPPVTLLTCKQLSIAF